MSEPTYRQYQLDCGEWQVEAKNDHGDVGYGCDHREAYSAMLRAKYRREASDGN